MRVLIVTIFFAFAAIGILSYSLGELSAASTKMKEAKAKVPDEIIALYKTDRPQALSRLQLLDAEDGLPILQRLFEGAATEVERLTLVEVAGNFRGPIRDEWLGEVAQTKPQTEVERLAARKLRVPDPVPAEAR